MYLFIESVLILVCTDTVNHSENRSDIHPQRHPHNSEQGQVQKKKIVSPISPPKTNSSATNQSALTSKYSPVAKQNTSITPTTDTHREPARNNSQISFPDNPGLTAAATKSNKPQVNGMKTCFVYTLSM